MNIVVVGDGKVGYALAEYLSQDGHDVTIVDRNPQVLSKAGDTLDVMCVRGNGANVRTLIEAGAEKADVLIAVTTNDETNMVCCLMAKQLGAKYLIARIRDPEYTESLNLFQEKMGIDMVINPERATAYEISRLLRYPFATDIETFAHGRVEMVEFRVEEKDEIAGQALRELHKKFPKVLFGAAKRGAEALIPGGDFVVRAGDRLYVAGDLLSINQFFKQIGKNTQRVKNAMLIGGGHISYYLAKIIAGMGIGLRVIEINRAKCEALSEQLPDDVLVICGDGTEKEMLDSENVSGMGALVCLTDRDEENLMTGLYGARVGVGKVIVKINRLNYMDVVNDLGIDSIVSPKRTTALDILRTVRALSHTQSAVVEKVYRIVGGQVEALEFTAVPGATYLNIPLMNLSIKPGVLVAVLVRNRRIIIPFGGDHIESGDTVILIARTGAIVGLDDALREAEQKR